MRSRAAGALAALGIAMSLTLGLVEPAPVTAAPLAVAGPPALPSGADHQVNAAFRLGGKTVAQSFAYDNTTNLIYTAQVDSNRNAEKQGDLLITRICNSGTSRQFGTIHLRDFGHGTSLGVEPVQRDAARRNCPAKPADAYLWLEVDSQPNSEGRGCGKKLARIRYHSGWTYTYSDGAITVSDGRGKPVDGDARVFDPLSGATMVSPVYDPSTDQVLVHYFRDHTWTYALFDRSDLLTHGDEATDLLAPGLAAPSPSEPDKTKKEYFQGVAFSGDWIYTLVGYRDRAITRITAFKTDGTSVSSAVVSAAVHQKLTRTYGTYEPEGMAVRILADGTPRLRWGMSVGKSGISKGRFNRKLVIFEKAAPRA